MKPFTGISSVENGHPILKYSMIAKHVNHAKRRPTTTALLFKTCSNSPVPMPQKWSRNHQEGPDPLQLVSGDDNNQK
ncbi:unnamed protein product [Parnassius mnemosyne]|uniref:Uncharacterized protein n=1 Tax=Parnassius mnemosyne TaxID=213953 RepID=A0AAV1L412_9NEOP